MPMPSELNKDDFAYITTRLNEFSEQEKKAFWTFHDRLLNIGIAIALIVRRNDNQGRGGTSYKRKKTFVWCNIRAELRPRRIEVIYFSADQNLPGVKKCYWQKDMSGSGPLILNTDTVERAIELARLSANIVDAKYGMPQEISIITQHQNTNAKIPKEFHTTSELMTDTVATTNTPVKNFETQTDQTALIESEYLLPEEIRENSTYPEGALKRISINKYERDPVARHECIRCYGFRCAACHTRLSDFYGQPAINFIHVHHLRRLADLGKDYKVDPRTHLRPLCPNCHAIAHRRDPPYTIEEISKMIADIQLHHEECPAPSCFSKK